MRCTNCENNLCIGGEHTFEEHGFDGVGIVVNATCLNEDCEVSDLLIYIETK
jgi:hypothetical protein|tara:strand:+ start:1678 stop:1833 length:156 start_codon:yes stop_codon:yes gene_type:complete